MESYGVAVFIQNHEAAIRLVFFLGILVLMGGWETLASRRPLRISRLLRWSNNLGLVVLNSILLRLVFPAAAVGIAVSAGAHKQGLFNALDAPLWISVPFSLLVLDFAIWLQHVVFHAVPLLWRLHRVHHADPDFDVTTGLRFHPFEILLSMLIKFMVILLLGPPVVAVIVFEVLLNATSMFNHGNVRLPLALDRWLRWLVVTPEMHRVHHSVEDDETNSNFGFNLPWWDRLFGTYRDQPRHGHVGMTIGIHTYHEPREVTWLPGLLALPFRGQIRDYAINRRQWDADREGHD
jgi:sterol desaturase/sphingolipid hydroxylase (fatty acid hydroxylase superfamily)